jgi:ABC-type transporter Mla subunit MlaD
MKWSKRDEQDQEALDRALRDIEKTIAQIAAYNANLKDSFAMFSSAINNLSNPVDPADTKPVDPADTMHQLTTLLSPNFKET